MTHLHGIVVSPGYAGGNVVVYQPPMLEGAERHAIEPAEAESEFQRFADALKHALEEVAVVRQQVAADVGETEAAIFDAHAAMLDDPTLKINVRERIDNQLICAEAALADEMSSIAKKLAASENAYMRELAMDVNDVGNRLMRHLSLDEGLSPLSSLPPNTIVIAKDLMPSETVCMDRDHVIGLASERGGPTSHAAILARSLGIPAATGLIGLLEYAESDGAALLDGTKGTLILEPTEAQTKRFTSLEKEFNRSQELMRQMEDRNCRLKNGTDIRLCANINQGGDVDLATEHNLDGIGLYRTELMYLSSQSAPTVQMQTRHYSRAAAACEDKPVTIRTFDFAVDKHPSFLSINAGATLEQHGLRFALNQPRLFKNQLRAIAASSRNHPNIQIMFPMVTGWWELKGALKMVRDAEQEAGLQHAIPIGAMIETPAAVFALPEILKLVDFISIGCNDLAQYTLAIERNSAGKTISDSALHPSLLRAIRQIVETAGKENCPVCICGEAASDPILASVFVGLGIRRLSVSPARAPVVRYALRHLSLSEAERAADCAIQADPSRVMHDLQAILPADLKPILEMESGLRRTTTKPEEDQNTPSAL